MSNVLKSEAPGLLKALRGALKDKSPVVRYTYANAAAGLAPLTTHSSLKHFVLHLKVWPYLPRHTCRPRSPITNFTCPVSVDRKCTRRGTRWPT